MESEEGLNAEYEPEDTQASGYAINEEEENITVRTLHPNNQEPLIITQGNLMGKLLIYL